jgi:hypothetical protein
MCALVSNVSPYTCTEENILLHPSFVIEMYLLFSGVTNETSAGDMKRVKHFVTICLLGLLLLEVS